MLPFKPAEAEIGDDLVHMTKNPGRAGFRHSPNQWLK